MIIDPYRSGQLAKRLALAMDNTLLPRVPRLYEGVVMPARRKLYDIAVKEKASRLVEKGGSPLFTNIEIETVNRCNYDCSFCPAGKSHERRPFRRMDESLFTSIIGQLRELGFDKNLAMYSNNEPLLDPRAVDFCALAKERVPKAFVYMFTNGSLLDRETFEGLMGSLDKLIIDNYSDDLKPIGQVHEVLKLCKGNERWRSKTVVVLRKKNEFRNNRAGRAPNRRSLVRLSSPCIYPFSQVVVRPDGKLSLCCNDVLGEETLGDLTREGILEAWRGKKYKDARRSMLTGRRTLELCARCDNITTEEIELAPHRLNC